MGWLSYTIGGDGSVALLSPRALLERGEPIDFDGRQIEPQCFIEMEVQRPTMTTLGKPEQSSFPLLPSVAMDPPSELLAIDQAAAVSAGPGGRKHSRHYAVNFRFM
jgi:hypothetical protein